jgi:hypothetical protein
MRMYKVRSRHSVISLTLIALLVCSIFFPISQANALGQIIFPMAGNGRYSNDYNSPRDGGPHHATDIFAEKGRPLLAAVTGTVFYVAYPQPSWGYMISIKDAEGYRYNYIHINNDTPGTDDGHGGGINAYAPDIRSGSTVTRGQMIGYVGDSGNAENTAPHLHFEIIDPSGNPVNPFDYLNNAQRLPSPIVYPQLPNEILPYGPSATMETSLALGNFDGDSDKELVVGPGKEGGPHVKIFEPDRTFTGKEFSAYDPYFYGGIDVAVGDIDGDQVDEIITAPKYGGGPHIRVFESTGELISEFNAYDPYFAGGVRVSAGDIDGDGSAEIVSSIESRGGPHVKVFEYTGQLISEFNAYDPYFTGGTDVAVGDVVPGVPVKEEIITSPGPGGGPHVKVFEAQGEMLKSFYVYGADFTGGVRVSAGEVSSSNPGEEIATAPWKFGGSHIRVIKGDGTGIREKIYLEPWWEGNYDVAAGNGNVTVGTGLSRRTTVRQAF